MTKLTIESPTGSFKLLSGDEGQGARELSGELVVCSSPTCSCRNIEFRVRAGEAGGQEGETGGGPLFELDPVDECCPTEDRGDWTDPQLGERLAAKVSPEEWESLREFFFAFKAHAIETMDVRTETVPFEFQKIESDGLLVPYSECFPFRPSIVVTWQGSTYAVEDHYCVGGDCRCTGVVVCLIPLNGETKDVKPACALKVNYLRQQWEDDDTGRPPEGLAHDLAAALEAQHPDILQCLRQRHERLRLLYRASRAALWFNPERLPARSATKPGRNDPCPCGSGKKYKKCCLDRDEQQARENRAAETGRRNAPLDDGRGWPDLSPEDWLWCLHCERFFQRKDLRPDRFGGREGCAFPDCDGAGLDFDIFAWDSWARQDPDGCGTRWPRSPEALFKGMRVSLHDSK